MKWEENIDGGKTQNGAKEQRWNGEGCIAFQFPTQKSNNIDRRERRKEEKRQEEDRETANKGKDAVEEGTEDRKQQKMRRRRRAEYENKGMS